jgi:hypothetical protein
MPQLTENFIIIAGILFAFLAFSGGLAWAQWQTALADKQVAIDAKRLQRRPADGYKVRAGQSREQLAK